MAENYQAQSMHDGSATTPHKVTRPQESETQREESDGRQRTRRS